MNAVQKLNPSAIRLYANGERFNLPSAFKLLKDGTKFQSNKFFDPVLMNGFNVLQSDVREALTWGQLLTSTLIVKNDNGKKLGEKIVFSDANCSITFIVNRVFQNELGIVADLMRDNFSLEISKDKKHATISELKEADSKAVKFICLWGQANDSTLWVPVKEVLDGKPSEQRRFNVPGGALAGLVGRMKGQFYFGYGWSYHIFVREPSESFEVLTEEAFQNKD